MATKKQKAELAIQYPEVRKWVLDYVSRLTDGGVHFLEPLDLFMGLPTISNKHVGAKEVQGWLISTKHLYNRKGAIALIKALLARLD